ncbi:MAG: FHA domain-containing protein [Candidatus Brocadiae bacterium]|nr:FHA domain-containing protein [Candidatus Brocadiia bacterium]
MAFYNSFRLRLTIIRKTVMEKEEIFSKSFYDIFFSQVPTRYIFIGSSEDADIKIDGLLGLHCSFNFQNDSLVWYSYGENRFIAEGMDKTLGEKELTTIPFSLQNDILVQWQVKILPFVYLEGIVWEERDILSDEAYSSLESMYGPIQKIQEGKACQIYQTKENKILKVLPNLEKKSKIKALQTLNAWKKAQTKRIVQIEKALDNPFHLCMEKLSGESLESYYARKGILSYKDSLIILRGLLKALKEMEGMDIDYPVFLPEGIFYSEGKIKVQSLHFSFPEKEFPEEFVPYLAPEYWQGNSNPKDWVKGNVFSIAAIFYRLLTGKSLYISRKVYLEAIERKIFLDRYTLLRSSPKITPQLGELLEAMLSFHAQDRLSPGDALQIFSEISDVGVWASSLRLSEEAKKESCRFGLEMLTSCGQEIKKVFPLKENSSIIIGRTGDIEVAKDSKVSKHHASLTLKDGQAILKDMGSKNGIVMDEKKVQECILPHGGIFFLGLTSFRFWDYGTIKETQKLLVQKKHDVPSPQPKKATLQEILEEEDKDAIDVQNYSIKSKKLQQIYETMEMPKMQEKGVQKASSPGQKTNSLVSSSRKMAFYIRFIVFSIGLILSGFAFFVLYLSLSPGTVPKTEPKGEEILVVVSKPPETPLPEPQQAFVPELSLDAKYVSSDRIQIQGHYNGKSLEMFAKTSKGETIYNQQIPLTGTSFAVSFLVPHKIEYIEVFTVLEGKKEKKSYRFLYPRQYTIAENLLVAKDMAIFFSKRLTQEIQSFLVSQNISSLDKALSAWEQSFDNKMKQKISGLLLINQENFGTKSMLLLELVREIEIMESTLKAFLLFRKHLYSQNTTIETIFSLSGALPAMEKIDKLSLQIWDEKIFHEKK